MLLKVCCVCLGYWFDWFDWLDWLNCYCDYTL